MFRSLQCLRPTAPVASSRFFNTDSAVSQYYDDERAVDSDRRPRRPVVDSFNDFSPFPFSAETCGVPLQSILTIGGVGGVAAAFGAKDILGNILSGLSVQISQPFVIGDTVKARSVEMNKNL